MRLVSSELTRSILIICEGPFALKKECRRTTMPWLLPLSAMVVQRLSRVAARVQFAYREFRVIKSHAASIAR